MRYARQPDKYSCGPTAILNAMKWAGLDATSRNHLPYLQFSCRTIDLQNPEDFDSNGTLDSDFDRVLRYVGKGVFRVRRKKNPTIKDIVKHLMAGGSVALSYFWQGDNGIMNGHFCFLAKMERGCIVTINDHYALNTETAKRRSQRTIKNWIKGKGWHTKKKIVEHPYAYFLTMEN